MDALKRYFSETETNMSSLAAKMGVAPTTLARPLRGERNANTDLALDVERATEGRVTAGDFLALGLEARKRAGDVEAAE